MKWSISETFLGILLKIKRFVFCHCPSFSVITYEFPKPPDTVQVYNPNYRKTAKFQRYFVKLQVIWRSEGKFWLYWVQSKFPKVGRKYRKKLANEVVKCLPIGFCLVSRGNNTLFPPELKKIQYIVYCVYTMEDILAVLTICVLYEPNS